MFLRRCLAFLFLLMFFSLCGCQSFVELARAMEEAEDEDYVPPPSRLRQNERERQAENQNENARLADRPREEKSQDDGFFRLILNERNGSFSLYFLSNPESMRYEPLFNASDPSASYLTAYVDGNVYQLGSSRHFKTRYERIAGAPAIIYESSFLIVTQVFKPIRTLSSQVANGVMITLTFENIATQISSVGLRMLIDTDLGEGRKQVPFITNTQIVASEMILEGNAEERFWVSRGKNVALMGSIISPVDEENEKGPDLVHMANWKRLNDSSWRLRYMKGRSFNFLPNSIRDSAVSYYFGPVMLDRGVESTYTIYLTTEDIAWYNLTAPMPVGTASILLPPPPPPRTIPAPAAAPVTPAAVPPPAAPVTPVPEQQPEVVPAPVYLDNATIDLVLIEAEAKAEADQYFKAGKYEFDSDVLFLMKLQDILDQFIAGLITLNEYDLINIEGAIEKLKVRN